jgi:naphthoate synthase
VALHAVLALKLTTLLYEEDGPIGRITMNRPDNGNMFNPTMCRELKTVLEETRLETRTRVLVLTGAGDRFFCIGGDKEGLEPTYAYPGVLPILDVYEAMERHQKPVIASVNGYAVGGGHVMHVMCDLTVAKESAVFRQVGPIMGSFDAGYGTWALEDLIGRKRAKEMWFLNEKLSAQQALEWGLVNRVVPDERLREETDRLAQTLAARGAQALAAVKGSFTARTGAMAGYSRMAHDMLLRYYLESDESKELRESFSKRSGARRE